MATLKPPLDLQAEIVYADNTSTRWDRDSRAAKDRPTGIKFGTQRYTGFTSAELALPRRIDLDYPDLGLLDGVRLIGHDGSVAYDGRIAALPRSLEGAAKIGVQAQGWMNHAKDQPFVEVYVDRDLSKWVAASAPRTAAVVGENFTLTAGRNGPDGAGHPSIELPLSGGWVSPYRPAAEAWWLPQPGITIGAIFYSFTEHAATMTAGDVNWNVHAILSSDDKKTAQDTTGQLWPGPTLNYLEATGTRTAACLQLFYGATPAGAAGAPFFARFENLAVFGSHGLSVRELANPPSGFSASDIIKNIAQRWAPKLDTSGVQETTLVIPHCSFLSDTLPYDAWQTLNAYHRWELAVYEDRKLQFYPIKLSDWDWEIRTDDPGTSVSLQGDDTTHLCNGVIVTYRDLNTGYDTRLTPEGHTDLRDESPDNPANVNGLTLYTTLSLSVPTTEEVALAAGRAYLAEFNQAIAPGTITVTGHARDRAGHWQPGWKVRSGERLKIMDLPSEQVRVVNETDWNHDTKQLSITVDSSVKRLDAVLARLGIAVEASGLALP